MALTTQLESLGPAGPKSQIPKPGGLQEKPGLQHCGQSTKLGVRGTWTNSKVTGHYLGQMVAQFPLCRVGTYLMVSL